MKKRKGFNDLVGTEMGIYCILNKVKNKIYIGSSKHIWQRFKQHHYDLTRNKHFCTKLQEDFNNKEVGIDDFIVLKEIEEENLDVISNKLAKHEELYIKKFKACNVLFGYNKNSKIKLAPYLKPEKYEDLFLKEAKPVNSFFNYEIIDEYGYPRHINLSNREIELQMFKNSEENWYDVENRIIDSL